MLDQIPYLLIKLAKNLLNKKEDNDWDKEYD